MQKTIVRVLLKEFLRIAYCTNEISVVNLVKIQVPTNNLTFTPRQLVSDLYWVLICLIVVFILCLITMLHEVLKPNEYPLALIAWQLTVLITLNLKQIEHQLRINRRVKICTLATFGSSFWAIVRCEIHHLRRPKFLDFFSTYM